MPAHWPGPRPWVSLPGMMTRNFGPYSLTGVSERSATCVAHIATHTSREESVELLEFARIRTLDPSTWKAFLGVMQRLNSVSSESLMTPIDHSRDPKDGAWYVAHEPIGLSLADLIARLGRLHWRQACMILHELARALSFAHSRGVAHGNLSPSVLRVDPTGQVQVRRFALLARIHLEIPDQAERGLDGIYDEVSYLSPEALQRRTPNLATDVFALGIIAYEMLVGEHPFGNMTGVIAYVESGGDPPDPSAAGVKMPSAVRDLVMNMLRIRVDRRVSDSGAVAQALRDQLNDVGVVKIKDSLQVELQRQSAIFEPKVAQDPAGPDAYGRASPDGELSDEAQVLLAQMMVASAQRRERPPLSQARWALILMSTVLLFGGGLYLVNAQRQARMVTQASLGAPEERSLLQEVETPELEPPQLPPEDERALPPDGDAVAVLLFKARSALERGEEPRAERLARSGLDITGPKNTELQWLLAQALERQGKTDPAVKAYLASDAAERGSTRGRLAAGFLLGASDRCGEAIEHYQRALAGGEDSARLHTLLGSCQLLEGMLEDAVKSLQKARARGGDQLDVLMPLGSALDLLGRRQLAREVYARVIQMHPQHRGAKAALDRIDVLRANPKQAQAWLEDRGDRQRDKADPQALSIRAHAAFTAGQHERAAELYAELLKLEPDEGAKRDLLKNLAIALDRARPGLESVEALERALRTLGEDPQLSLLLGKRLMAMGRAKEAMRHLEMASSSPALKRQARFELGLAKLESGDAQGAVTEFGSLVASQPGDRRAIQNLARAQVDAGLSEAALVTLERFESLAPRDAQPWLTRAAILQRMERHDEASKLLKRACGLGVQEACP